MGAKSLYCFCCNGFRIYYSDFQSYKVHLSPLIAGGEGVGGGVHVPGLMTICCKTELTAKNYPFQVSASGRPAIFIQDSDCNIIELSQFMEQ